MSIKNVLKNLFRPNDGSRRAVTLSVDLSIEKTNDAVSKLHQTISDFLNENDKLTKRNVRNVAKHQK